MIDQSDVSNALANTILGAVYPNGTGAAPVAAKIVRIFPGWPDPVQMLADLTAGNAQISIYPLRTERNTTAGSPEWITVSTNAPTLTTSITGKVVTIGGTVSVPQNVMIAVNSKAYIYGVQAGDTLSSIASALAGLVAVDVPATASGATVTVPSAINLKAAVGVQGIAVRELRRQAKMFQITVWANAPAVRDSLAMALDVALAKVPRLPLSYGFAGHMVYKGGHQDDSQQKAGIYRRDLMLEIDYPTVETETETTILGIQDNLNQIGNAGVNLSSRIAWSS